MKRQSRSRTVSNSVAKSTIAGASASPLLIYAAMKLQAKYGIDPEITAGVAGLVVTGWQSLVAWKSKGGRKGETE